MNDPDFLQAFEDRTLPFEAWTHRAHVKVAFLYLTHHAFDQALTRLRASIKAYNAANNVPEDQPMRGYNETTTRAFLMLVASVMQAYAQTHPVTTADEFCDMHPQLMSRHVLRFFYSPQQRLHPLAKTQFVEPDLAPLPTPNGCARPRLYRVIIPVQDIERAATFYSQVLRIVGKRVSPGRHYFDCGGTILACYDPFADGDKTSLPSNPEHIYIAIADLEKTFDLAQHAGCGSIDPIKTWPWGEHSFYAQDPFGNPICFVDEKTVFRG